MDRHALYTYLGTVDDVVTRFPWKFKVGPEYVFHTLLCNWILGRRLIINDGYLVNNQVLRDAIKGSHSILRLMMADSSIVLASRGYRYLGKEQAPVRRFGLHEMPEQMAHIPSFERIVASGADGDDWPVLRRRLESIDGIVAEKNLYLPWPPFDTGSGYLALVRNIMDNSSFSARSVGFGQLISSYNLKKFLVAFEDHMARNPKHGPRTVWEDLARSFADDPDVTNQPAKTMNTFMRLANEIYHYNFGVGLAASYDVNIAVETQPSEAFDELLIKRGMMLSRIEDFPVPFIPKSLTVVAPDKIIGSFATDSRLGDARLNFIRLNQSSRAHETIPLHLARSLKEASDQLSREIFRVFASDIQKEIGQGTFGFAYDSVKSLAKPLVYSGTGAIAGYATSDPYVAAASAVAAAFLTYWAGNKIKPIASNAYKLILDNSPNLPPEIIRNSTMAIRAIKRQNAPINLEIKSSAIKSIADRMLPFTA